MTTDNRTNEQIVAEALRRATGPFDLPNWQAEQAVSALDAAGRLAGESKNRQNDAKHFAYTDEQVEAAAKVIYNQASLDEDAWDAEDEREKVHWREDARAVLVAAALAGKEKNDD